MLPLHIYLKKKSLPSGLKKAFEYKKGVPSKLNRQLFYGRVGAAVISSIESRHKRYKRLDIGICADKMVWSVLVKKNENLGDFGENLVDSSINLSENSSENLTNLNENLSQNAENLMDFDKGQNARNSANFNENSSQNTENLMDLSINSAKNLSINSAEFLKENLSVNSAKAQNGANLADFNKGQNAKNLANFSENSGENALNLNSLDSSLRCRFAQNDKKLANSSINLSKNSSENSNINLTNLNENLSQNVENLVDLSMNLSENLGEVSVDLSKNSSVNLTQNSALKFDPASATSNILALILNQKGQVIIGDKALKFFLENSAKNFSQIHTQISLKNSEKIQSNSAENSANFQSNLAGNSAQIYAQNLNSAKNSQLSSENAVNSTPPPNPLPQGEGALLSSNLNSQISAENSNSSQNSQIYTENLAKNSNLTQNSPKNFAENSIQIHTKNSNFSQNSQIHAQNPNSQIYAKNPDFTDLCQLWHERFNLPFVFARFCCVSNFSFFKKIFKNFSRQKIFIPRYILDFYAQTRGIPAQNIKDYLKLIYYKISLKEKRALKLFLSKATPHLKEHK